MFLGVAIYFLHIVKKYHSDFYKPYKNTLWGTVVALTTPLIIRCLMDSLQSWPAFSEFTNKSNKRVAIYNLVFFFLTTYILILSQTATLVFGFLRSKQSKRIVQTKKEIKK